jgi:uncharacterized protein
MRAIVFLLLVVLVFFIIRFTLNKVIQIRDHNKKLATDSSEGKTAEAMVRCALCGVHLPQSDAYYDGKDTFCSEGHMNEFHNEKSTHSTED